MTNIEKGYPFFQKKGKAFLHFLKITYWMKKGMMEKGLSHREKGVKKINFLHVPIFTSKKFVILKLPEPLLINMFLIAMHVHVVIG